MNETKQTRELNYDLPFGKASQTAKRFEVEELTPQPLNGSPTDDLLYDQSASQDLFATQENIFVNRKRTKRLQAQKVIKKDLNDNLKNSVNGHIQQLRSKLAHRVTVNTSLALEQDEKLSSKINFSPEGQSLPLDYSNNENSDQSPFLKFDNECLPHKSETWDELNVSLYQRWMTDVSYPEEE